MFKDYYSILDLSYPSNNEEIKQAYQSKVQCLGKESSLISSPNYQQRFDVEEAFRVIGSSYSLKKAYDEEYLQGLSLTASNKRWLGERLIESSADKTSLPNEEEQKLKKLNALFGSWSGEEGERIEAAVNEARRADYERKLVSMDE